jgi:hypothetical protein
MRTTLDIDDDVLAAARAIARERGRSVGGVVSDLARRALTPQSSGGTRNGIPQLPIRSPSTCVTLEHVNALRDEAP